MSTPESPSPREAFPVPAGHRSASIVYDPIFLEHGMLNHVESPRRIQTVMNGLDEQGLKQQIQVIPARPATLKELLTVHKEDYISQIKSFAGAGGGWWDEDTFLSSKSYEAALYAAGGTINAVAAVASGDTGNAYALVRPPGHHATPSQAMGFCLFNNIAIATRYALDHLGIRKVCIIDFDVHRGNGTHEMFRKDPRVLYVSTHQYPLFPDSGPYDEYSQGGRDRRSILLPLPAGCGDDEFRRVYTEIVAPMVRRFKPELILVSAGYDAHWADEMSHMRLTIDGFHFLVELIDKLAIECYGGGTVYTLEGGYHLSVIRACVNNTFSYWLGESFIEDPLGPPPNAIHAYKFDYVMEQLKRRYGLADGQPGRLIFDSHSGE